MQNGIEKFNKILRTYDKIKYLTFQEKKSIFLTKYFFSKLFFPLFLEV